MENDAKSVSKALNSFSVPGYLRKVFTDELGNDDGGNHKLLVIAVHAVLLESGFLQIDSVSNSRNWNLASLHYTLPTLITTTGKIETVKIKFQNLGNYCTVYGSVVNGIVHSVLLDEDKLVPLLKTLGDHNQEVLEFWRKTKDGLAFPLLIDLCRKTGLKLPPCYMQLPTELKLKLLDALSGVEIAKVSCVCADLRSLASDDGLWKRKYVAEFGNFERAGSERGFKERFAKAWEGRKMSGSGRWPLYRMNFDLFGTEVGGGDPDEWEDYMARDCLRRIGRLRGS